jgi:pimeloyl-ACP methyl ester carboxylesterase
LVQIHERTMLAVPDTLFNEGYIEADGFRIRYKEAGQGEPLVSLHGAGGMRIYRSHALLAEQYRVIVFEVPGFGQSPANERSQSMPEIALTMAQAVSNLGLERFNLMGNSFGGKLALWLAVQQPERIQALVLVAPAAIRPEGGPPLRRSHQRNGGPGCMRIRNVRRPRHPWTRRLWPSNRSLSAASWDRCVTSRWKAACRA